MSLNWLTGALKPYVLLPIGFALFLSLIMKKAKPITYPNPNPNLPRGLRNYNPGNLRRSSSPWVGKIRPSGDPEFEQFTSMEWGARAQMKNTITWFKRGRNTLQKLISTWAPPSENDTQAYIDFVSAEISLAPDFVFDLTPELLIDLSRAIAIQENGNKYRDLLSRELYQKAYYIL
jgi:hypothetical protein